MAGARPARTPEATRQAIVTSVRRGEGRCAAPLCLYERDGGDRDIDPESTVTTYRNSTGTALGPAHWRCIQSDRATRGNQLRAARFLKL